MTSRSFLATSSIMAFAALLGACGSDSGGGGDVDAFCEEIRRSESAESVDISEDFDAGMAEMERFRELAPGELRDDIDVLIDAFRKLDGLESSGSGDDEDEFAAVMELMFDPAFLQASNNLEQFGVEECGIEPSSDDGPPGDVDIDASGSDADDATSADGSDGDVVGPIVSEAAPGVSDPLFDPFFDDEVDLGVVSYEGAQYFIDVNYTDAPWRTRLGSWTLIGGDSPEIGAGGFDLTEAEAVEVCGALVEYLLPFDPAGTVTITTYGQNTDGTFGDETELLSVTASDGC